MFKLKSNAKKKKVVFIAIFVMMVVLFLANFLFSPEPVLAQDANTLLWGGQQGAIGNIIGLGDQDPRIIVAKIIRVFIGFLGIIALGLIIYAGWLWMTSEGDEQKIEMAKKVLKNALIGLVIILASFGIVTFLINRFYGATTGGGPAGGPRPPGGGGLAALGAGIIESHYPARNQKGVPRNTNIVVTFKEPMDITTLIEDTNGNGTLGDWDDTLGSQPGIIETGEYDKFRNVIVYKSNGDKAVDFEDRFWAITADSQTFLFRQIPPYIGSPSENIWYTAELGLDIKKANGNDAFPGAIGFGYDWSFEVSTIIDVTPPQIESIIPLPAAVEPRNVVIQINFNEAINPLSASGETNPPASFRNIEVNNITGPPPVLVNGIFYISNQYRTVEFLTDVACGTNSCGNTIYCLPANATLSSLVKAATLFALGSPSAVFPYDGAVDMADNSLDGNKDGTAEGPESQSGKPPLNANNPDPVNQGDDYQWTFSTTNTIDITAPAITSINPLITALGVGLDVIPQAVFNKILMSSTLNSSNIAFIPSAGAINYWLTKVNGAGSTTVYINHDGLMENTSYKPQFISAIRDIYQNCYSPCSGLGVTGAPSCCEGVPTGGAVCP